MKNIVTALNKLRFKRTFLIFRILGLILTGVAVVILLNFLNVLFDWRLPLIGYLDFSGNTFQVLGVICIAITFICVAVGGAKRNVVPLVCVFAMGLFYVAFFISRYILMGRNEEGGLTQGIYDYIINSSSISFTNGFLLMIPCILIFLAIVLARIFLKNWFKNNKKVIYLLFCFGAILLAVTLHTIFVTYESIADNVLYTRDVVIPMLHSVEDSKSLSAQQEEILDISGEKDVNSIKILSVWVISYWFSLSLFGFIVLIFDTIKQYKNVRGS